MDGIHRTFVIALLATTVLCIPERVKRSYEDGRGGGPTGYGVDSGELDNASVDHAPCAVLDSGSREHGYEFGQPGQEASRGFSVKAAAAASSSTFS